MTRTQLISLILVFLFSTNLSGQEHFDIKNPDKDYYKKCDDCIELMKNKPPEIQFGIQKDLSNELYFVVTHKEWYNEMFKKGSDGIAIDIVKKDRYSCDNKELNKKSMFRGDLQKPIYSKELKKRMLQSENGEVVIKLGKIPKKYLDEEVEFNIVIIKNKYLCYYNNFYDLKSYRWGLLELGMYMDTLTYKSEYNKSVSAQEKYILSHKTLRFEIPFEKNKSTYSSEDIQPLYDSLRLTDYNIRKITIRAFSSVEGNSIRNIELQNERANSIVNALQKFQKPTIENEITVSENWVEFLTDIVYSKYSSFSELSKEQIKEKLKNKSIAKELEPQLKNHRKAIVILELQKKNKYGEIPASELLELFQKSISEKNLEQAIEIQNSLFDKVRNQEVPTSFVDKLEIPEQSEFGLLKNKNTIFKYLLNKTDVYESLLELKKLEDLLPKDGHIKYNIASMKFKVWLLGDQAVDPVNFKKEITALKYYGISNNLVKRMLINYNIVMCEYYMMSNDFRNKDRSLRYIHQNYKYLPLTDSDYLSLAQYFSSYSKYDWSKKLLLSKVKSINVDEDLLFYYLNLTLIDDKITKRSDYRTIMLNAININKERFCDLFDPYGEGGITFQLLENDYLRKTYCENCTQ
jgi:hypothetical protein